jgi:hypothetical protein
MTRYDPAAFSVSNDQLDFTDPASNPPQELELRNNEDTEPIPWRVKIIRDDGNSTNPEACQQVNWLQVNPKKGKLKYKGKDDQGGIKPGAIVSVSVEKKDLPPGTICVAKLEFKPGDSKEDQDNNTKEVKVTFGPI